jgi:hypothetical protein
MVPSGKEDGCWYGEECYHCTFTRNTTTFTGLNTKLISNHPVNYTETADESKKIVSLNKWAIVLKTNIFNVKEPSTRDDNKSADDEELLCPFCEK